MFDDVQESSLLNLKQSRQKGFQSGEAMEY